MVRPARHLLVILALALPKGTEATEIRPNDLNFAGRSGSMAGTQVGLGGDLSSAWFNPAGLAAVQEGNVSLGATLIVHRSTRIEHLLGTQLQVDDENAYSAASISSFGLFGGTLALAVLTPGDTNFRYRLTLPEAESSRDKVSTDYLLGLAYGHRLSDRWDMGVAGYYVYRESRSDAYDWRRFLEPGPSGLVELQINRSETSLGHGILLSWGGIWKPKTFDGKLQFGVAGKWGFDLDTDAEDVETRFERRRDEAGGFVRSTSRVRGDQTSSLPGSLAIGLGYRPFERLALGVDVTLTGLFPVWDIMKHLETVPTVNFSSGTALKVGSSVSLLAGVFTNWASAAQEGAELRPTTWDEYGATLGILNEERHASIALGLRGSLLSSAGSVTLVPGERQSIAIQGWSVQALLGSGYRF